ncbi:MAG: hypothetical protein M0Z84_11040 [Gammaproteobacteria bacterium]|nr:hypothetical protein [Gammaproteobacteria bacterium]
MELLPQVPRMSCFMCSIGGSFSCHLKGSEHLAEVITGAAFKDGVAVPKRSSQEIAA